MTNAPVAVTLDWDFWVSQYLNHLRLELGRSPLTIRGYEDNLRYFRTYLMRTYGEATIEHLIWPVCRQYLMQWSETGHKPKTIRKALAPLKGLIRYLTDEGVLRDTTWVQKLRGPKVVERRADPLSHDEAQQLLRAIPRYTIAGQRDRILFHLFLDTGLRISEMLNLTVADCRLDIPAIIVRHGKGDKDRTVPLSDEMAAQLRYYLTAVRPALARPQSPSNVWLSSYGRPLAHTTLRSRLRYYARLAGLEGRRLYPHKLRATFATRLDQVGTNVTVIQELMGHADIKTTSHYVGIASQAMRDAINRLRPLD